MNIADIRKEYKLQTLLETEVEASPFAQFTKWWDDALKSEKGLESCLKRLNFIYPNKHSLVLKNDHKGENHES